MFIIFNFSRAFLIFLGITVALWSLALGYCSVGVNCNECNLFTIGNFCLTKVFIRNEYFYCDKRTNKVLLDQRAFLDCKNNTIQLEQCPSFHTFIQKKQTCVEFKSHNKDFSSIKSNKHIFKRSAGGIRTGDMCNFNTDCQSGMYCYNGVCTCLSDYVAISGYCWPKINPGESGCVEDLQCEAVWPGAKCSRGGICTCPDYTMPSKTRDGTVCVTYGVPPACPLPEPNNPEVPNPATILANLNTHPLAQNTYMPVLCTSTSSEIEQSNKGDGSTWCIFPDGNKDIYIADIYNCVQHPQVKPEFFPEYADTINGICCHNRAFVCIQPMEQGDEPSIPRWWYNSVTGTCTQFLWDSSQSENVSPNNFRTVEHCESYCRDTCSRGPIQFGRNNRGTILEETPISNCLHQTASCGPEYHCTLIGSHQHCCPTIGNICSAHGGRGHLYMPKERFDAGVAIAGSRSVSRFFYDAEQGKCSNFIYEGLGNYNNFFTKQDCENFCSKLVCQYGNPLRIGEEWQRCESNADCPHSHQCESAHKVCCPTAQSICTQAKRLGDCTSSVRRYYYNAATRQCEVFQYTGCQGNDNNFDSLLDCQQKCRNVALEPKCPHGRPQRDTNNNFFQCSIKTNKKTCPQNYQCYFDGSVNGCCPTKAYTCSLSSDKGVQCGSGRSFRYYFNANKQTCESFQYEGCDGNSNSFQTVEECQDYCGVGGCPNGGQPLREITSNEYTLCNAEDGKGCPETHECVGINFNGNMAQRCCPTKAHICSLSPQQGNLCTKVSVTRWYFNIATKECGKFSYNGCNGNLNNFGSFEQCTNFCSSAACASGEITYKDFSTKELTICSPSISNSCPLDYECKLDPLSTKHVCCGSPYSNYCPTGEKPYVNALDESVKECAINVAGSCPGNFLCRFSSSHNRYYCCASKSGNVCPDGKALYRTQFHQPMRCNLKDQIDDFCPKGFTCQSRVNDVLQGYCCTSHHVCKNGADFIIDKKTLMPKMCMQGGFNSCEKDSGYRCHRSTTLSANSNSYCCKNDKVPQLESSGCPPNEFVYVEDTKVVECNPFNLLDKGCPPKYSCQYAVEFQRYQCCGKEPIEKKMSIINEHGCLSGQVAYVQFGALNPKVCTFSDLESCPVGFFCQFSDRNNQFQCCALKAGCPKNTVAYIDINGNPKTCKFGDQAVSRCPIGYSCRKTSSGDEFCCTIEGVDGFASKKPVFAVTSMPNKIIGKKNQTKIIRPDDSLKVEKKLIATFVPTPSTTSIAVVKTTTAAATAKEEEEEEPKCQDNEYILKGRCVGRKIGEKCLLNRQCPRTTVCDDFVCRCPLHTVRSARKCVDSRNRKKTATNLSKPYSSRITCPSNKLLYKGQCLRTNIPIGATCVTSVQCKLNARCIDFRCKCTEGFAGYNNNCYVNVCGLNSYRVPQLSIASNVVKCTNIPNIFKQRCKYLHRCIYSKVVHDYICCKSMPIKSQTIVGYYKTKPNIKQSNSLSLPWKSDKSPFFVRTSLAMSIIATTPKTNQLSPTRQQKHLKVFCQNGNEPLLFPGSSFPIKCFSLRSCPTGFTCLGNFCCKPTPVSAQNAPTNRNGKYMYHSIARLPGISLWKVISFWMNNAL